MNLRLKLFIALVKVLYGVLEIAKKEIKAALVDEEKKYLPK